MDENSIEELRNILDIEGYGNVAQEIANWLRSKDEMGELEHIAQEFEKLA